MVSKQASKFPKKNVARKKRLDSVPKLSCHVFGPHTVIFLRVSWILDKGSKFRLFFDCESKANANFFSAKRSLTENFSKIAKKNENFFKYFVKSNFYMKFLRKRKQNIFCEAKRKRNKISQCAAMRSEFASYKVAELRIRIANLDPCLDTFCFLLDFFL